MCAPEFSDIEVTLWQEYRNRGVNVVGISNEPVPVIENFIADQGITFPVLHDDSGVYNQYNIPGGQSPYPRDYILDSSGILRMASTEYDPGRMISILEELLAGTTDTADNPPAVPAEVRLYPAFPNPFNPATALHFYLPSGHSVNLEILDLLGRAVATLARQREFPAGHHTLSWNGTDDQGRPLPSGVYVARLKAGQWQRKTKLILMR
ncbi:MAG: T9SS C-terminal target domain-containing protein [Candidatus Neomarinimicrobiota bacterium]|nr:MAG: T9SS C-terminal target domain-containing protein [Candidatus Neomarinimicrobiota bacterium]